MLDLNLWQNECDDRRHDKDRCPGEESGDGDKSACSGAPVLIKEVDAAAEVDGEQQGIQRQVDAVAGTMLEDQQEGCQGTVKQDHCPAKRVIEHGQREERESQGQEAEEKSGWV